MTKEILNQTKRTFKELLRIFVAIVNYVNIVFALKMSMV